MPRRSILTPTERTSLLAFPTTEERLIQHYRTRENLRYCKEHGIRLSGPKLGRPPKHLDPEERKPERQDMGERNAVEGKFGEAKLRTWSNSGRPSSDQRDRHRSSAVGHEPGKEAAASFWAPVWRSLEHPVYIHHDFIYCPSFLQSTD
jgi:hypothetical protein